MAQHNVNNGGVKGWTQYGNLIFHSDGTVCLAGKGIMLAKVSFYYQEPRDLLSSLYKVVLTSSILGFITRLEYGKWVLVS